MLIVGALMVLPLLQPGLATPTPAAAPTTQPPTRAAVQTQAAPVVVAGSTTVPTVPPTTPPRPGAPTAQPASNALLDARFTGGPQKGWLENPPFAGWRDGAYRFAARQATRFVAVPAPVPAQDNVLVSATLRKTGGPPGGGYGIIVRNQVQEQLDGANQSFGGYVLETGDLGEFGIWRRAGDRWIDLVPWTRSQAVRQGGSPNELVVKAQENRLLFTINGIEVARVDDDALPHGGVGVFVGGDLNEVALDRFTVQSPN
jgi:hypothetical protein